MKLRKILKRGRVLNIASLQLKLEKEPCESQQLENKNEIIVWTNCRVRKMIREWTQYGGWSTSDFARCLELASVNMPVTLDDLDEEKETFQCITEDGKELEISFSYKDEYGFSLKERISDKIEIRKYNVTINRTPEEKVPIVALQEKTICKNGKVLECDYLGFSCQCTLKIDESHELELYISKPKRKNFTMQHCNNITDYLIELDNSLVVDKVYVQIIRLLDFSIQDINECDDIMISYTSIINEKEIVCERIRKCKGKLQEYAFQKNGATYYMCKDGKCSVTNDRITVLYEKDEDTISIKLTDYKNITKIDFQHLINCIIRELKGYNNIF